ncbi:MAG: diguanylate cyclase [Spirochaetota bacterium]
MSLFYRNLAATVIIFTLLAVVLLVYLLFMSRIEYRRQVRLKRDSYISIQKERVWSLVNYELVHIRFLMNREDRRNRDAVLDKMDSVQTAVKSIAHSHDDASSLPVDQYVRSRFPSELVPANMYLRIMTLDGGIIYNNEYQTENETTLKNITDATGQTVVLDELRLVNRDGSGWLESYWKRNGTIEKKYTRVDRIEGEPLYIALSMMHQPRTDRIRSEVLTRISSHYYEEGDSVYIFDYTGTVLAHTDHSLVGHNISDMTDATGVYVIQELLKAQNEEDGVFLEYMHPHPDEGTGKRRLVYARCYEQWQWCVASSVGIDEVDRIEQSARADARRRIQNECIFLIVSFILAIGAAGGYYYHISSVTKREISMFTETFKKAATHHERIDSGKISLYELNSLAVYANMMLDEIREEKKMLQKLSFHDPLTGIYNRNKYNEIIEHEIEIFQRFKNPFTIIMFDIDHFKQVNDTHGHPKGDEILIELVHMVSSRIRTVDTFIRWGGEEFLILLPRTTRYQARQFAEKLRNGIWRHTFASEISLTISAGIASLRVTDNAFSIVARADKALYESKKSGRNKITVA